MPPFQESCWPRAAFDAANRASTLFRIFEPLGGVLGGTEAAEQLRNAHSQPVSQLARWIVDRSLMHFTWKGEFFLPRFQFECDSLGIEVRLPRPGIKQVCAELNDAFDDWEQIEWFATPNVWLRSSEPANIIAVDVDLVAQAARADRFIARGW